MKAEIERAEQEADIITVIVRRDGNLEYQLGTDGRTENTVPIKMIDWGADIIFWRPHVVAC